MLANVNQVHKYQLYVLHQLMILKEIMWAVLFVLQTTSGHHPMIVKIVIVQSQIVIVVTRIIVVFVRVVVVWVVITKSFKAIVIFQALILALLIIVKQQIQITLVNVLFVLRISYELMQPHVLPVQYQ